jgi:hypothetical protein
MIAPRLLLADASEHRLHLHARDLPVGDVLELERDARNELVLSAAQNARVVPAGVNVDDLEIFLDLARLTRRQEQRRKQGNRQPSYHQ